MFEGSMVAIVTPFLKGKVDEQALRQLVEFHVQNGTRGIVPCGTTGGSATLSHEEHREVVAIVVDACKKRIPVLAGTGSNSTREAVLLTQAAQKAGADGVLLITPYYNKPTQQGLFEHFSAVARETNLPVVLYNVPGRTSVNMLPETVGRLSQIKNIIGIKEASGSLQQISEVIQSCGKEFILLSGDDGLLWPILAVGGKGVISVTANILPEKMARLCAQAAEGKIEEARKLHYELMDINNVLFIETNPIPVKAALWLMGKIAPELRPPLTALSEASLGKLRAVMKQYGLIS